MTRTMRPALRRLTTLAAILTLAQAGMLAATPNQALASRCEAPDNYCYDADCSGGCTTKDCNGSGNCSGTASYKCYDCVRAE
jgi:hypothetical protein